MGADFGPGSPCRPRPVSRTRSTPRRDASSGRSPSRRSATSDIRRGCCATSQTRAVVPGAAVLAGGEAVGEVTSAAAVPDGVRRGSSASCGTRRDRLADRQAGHPLRAYGTGVVLPCHFASATWGFARTATPDPFRRHGTPAMKRFPVIGPAGTRGEERNGADRSVPDRRLSTSPDAPYTTRFLAGARRLFRRRSRRLLPDLRGGGRPGAHVLRLVPIREECLSWALKNGERYGVWGGTTEQQRRRFQRHVA